MPYDPVQLAKGRPHTFSLKIYRNNWKRPGNDQFFDMWCL